MPFTPFHMGLGAAIKAAAGRYFSLTVFGFAHVAMDIEPLVRMLHRDAVLHGFTHTYLGATLVAVAVLVIGVLFCQRLLRTWNLLTKAKFLRWLQAPDVIAKPAAISGAVLGTYSHVFLDSIMHDDMRPWLPFNNDNGLLHAIPGAWLHLLCLDFVGLMALLVIFVWNKIAIEI